MVEDLRSAYNQISDDYLRKKEYQWQDFSRFLSTLDWNQISTIIDVGGGNGRNLQNIDSNLYVVLDLSIDLLKGYVGPSGGQQVAGALPHLPFRSEAASHVIAIAVLHHFRDPTTVVQSLRDMSRIGDQAKYIFSVWRRWRRDYREKLIDAIKSNDELTALINHDRPWYSSNREVLATRFYHYYTFRELYDQLSKANLQIDQVKYLGGKYDDANIFVAVSSQSLRK